jgi:hypothetical protein
MEYNTPYSSDGGKNIQRGMGSASKTTLMREVVTTEAFNYASFPVEQFKKTRLGMYTERYDKNHACKECTDEEREQLVPRDAFSNFLWITYKGQVEANVKKVTKGLFVLGNNPGAPIQGNIYVYVANKPTPIHLIYKGIRKTDMDIFGFYMSSFMNIGTKRDKGGFFKRFIGGLIRAILGLIGAVLELFLRIPILKQIVEVFMKIIGVAFGVDGATALEILKRVIFAVIMVVAMSFIAPMINSAMGMTTTTATTTASVASATGLSVGMVGGINTALTYSSYAMQAFSAAQNGKAVGEMREIAEKRANDAYQKSKALAASQASNNGFIGTLGTQQQNQSSDFIMYEAMFNPITYMEQALPPEELPADYLF